METKIIQSAEVKANPSPPTRTGAGIFLVKSKLLQIRRTFQNTRSRIRSLTFDENAADHFPHLIGQSITPLWNESADSELRLQLGKVHNLRLAVKKIDHCLLPAGEVFSFWRQVGRAARRRGFVEGRQISEGCLIPAVGGGLCQLSNALYEAALQADFKILERHPHSRIIPGSAAEAGRDATVFWNYLDLRFQSEKAILIRASLTPDHLIVRFFGVLPLTSAPLPRRPKPPEAGLTLEIREHSCTSCGAASCFRHLPAVRSSRRFQEKTAFLVDGVEAEWQEYLYQLREPQDVLGVPLDGQAWKQPRYAWNLEGYAAVEAAAFATLKSAVLFRRLSMQGAAKQAALLVRAEKLSRAYRRLLSPEVTRICVSQALLPFLWRGGQLGGRRFEVLMTSLPRGELERSLDTAFRLYPQSKTLNDYRAPEAIVAAEQEALAAAEKIVTCHSAVFSLFPRKAVLLDWKLPFSKPITPGNRVVFAGPTVGRKGAYELREAALKLDLEVTLTGRVLESPDFWQGVRTRQGSDDVPWFQEAKVVVAPSWIENNPRRLLEAIAAGVPVIATPVCGLGALPGVMEVPCGDIEGLTEALSQALA